MPIGQIMCLYKNYIHVKTIASEPHLKTLRHKPTTGSLFNCIHNSYISVALSIIARKLIVVRRRPIAKIKR